MKDKFFVVVFNDISTEVEKTLYFNTLEELFYCIDGLKGKKIAVFKSDCCLLDWS